jgi:hypothetical protein
MSVAPASGTVAATCGFGGTTVVKLQEVAAMAVPSVPRIRELSEAV